MSKVLLLSPWVPPADGVAFHSQDLAGSWSGAGHEVLVITSSSKEDKHSASSSSENHRIRVARTLGSIPRKSDLKIVEEFCPDVVVVQFAIASQSTVIFSTLRIMNFAFSKGLPVVVAYHEPTRELNRFKFMSRKIYKLAARFTTFPVVYSLAAETTLREEKLFEFPFLLPHGCRPPIKPSLQIMEHVLSTYKVSAPLVLSVGFTHRDKGTDLLVAAMPEISRRLNGNVQFLVAGSPRSRKGIFKLMSRSDRKYHRMLLREMDQMEAVKVQACEYIPDEDLASLIYIASANVLPYRRCTQSGIANESLSARAVIVASDISELKDDLGDAAKYFHSEDVLSLTETLVVILSENSNELREVSARRAGSRSYDATAESLLKLGLSS